MDTIKPNIGVADVERIVRECTGETPANVTRLSSGQIAATFECVVVGRSRIVQFNKPHMAASLSKERFFGDRLRGAGVPLRRVITEGEFDGTRYTIAEKAPGRMLSALEPARFRAALPSVFRTLAGISSVDMRDTDGFGWFDAAGHGPDAGWKAHLRRVAEEEPGMFFGNWHRLFETTFLERDRYDAYFARMTELLDAISVPRLLVHGGFGYGNVLVEDDAVTVVLDWQDARFGDPLFDLAYMDFWPSGHDLTELFRPYCKASAIGLEDYDERLLACKYYVAMDSMRFFAMVGNGPAYDAVVKIMEAAAG